MKKLVMVFTALFFSFTSLASIAADLKIGVIDMNQILQKAPLMISLNNDLIKKFQTRQNELNNTQKQLQDETNQFNINGASMSATDRAKSQNKIINDQANVQILTASLQRDLAIAKDESLQKFMSKFNDVITQIANEDKYDLIQQSTNIAFVNSQLDITQKVLSRIK